MSKLELTITTPLDTIYSDSVDQITLTTAVGEITILPQHVPMISHLKTGHVMVKKGDNETYFAIDGGLLDVRRDHSVVVLSDRSEHVDAIDLERAEAAIKKAEAYMKEPHETAMDYAKLQTILAKEQNRAKLARQGRRK